MTPSPKSPDRPPRHRPQKRSLVPVLIVGLLFVPTIVLFETNQRDHETLTLLLWGGVLASATNLLLSWLGLGKRNGIGAVVLHGGTLFWFYGGCAQTIAKTGEFEFHGVAVSAFAGEYLQAFALVGTFYFLATLTYAIPPPARLRVMTANALGNRSTITPRTLKRIVLGTFFVGFGFYLIAAGGPAGLIEAALGSRAYGSAWDSRGNFGTGLSSLHFLSQAMLVVGSNIAFYLAVVKKGTRWRSVYFAIFAINITYVTLESGTRLTTLQAIVPALLVWVGHLKRESLGRQVVSYGVLASLLFGLAFASVYQRLTRSTGAREVQSVELNIDSDFLSETALSVSAQRQEKTYTYDVATAVVVFGVVPRALWENKPAPTTYVVYSKYRFGYDVNERGGNALPSIVGQYYMGWGWFGVVEVGLFFGFLIGLIDRVLERRRSDWVYLAGAIALSYLFAVFRYVSFGFFPPILVVLIISVVTWRRREHRRRPAQPSLSPRAAQSVRNT